MKRITSGSGPAPYSVAARPLGDTRPSKGVRIGPRECPPSHARQAGRLDKLQEGADHLAALLLHPRRCHRRGRVRPGGRSRGRHGWRRPGAAPGGTVPGPDDGHLVRRAGHQVPMRTTASPTPTSRPDAAGGPGGPPTGPERGEPRSPTSPRPAPAPLRSPARPTAPCALLRLPGPQRLQLPVHPPPQCEVLRHAGLGLRVTRDGVEPGDLVLRPPSQRVSKGP